jgi:hypothetical protein
MKQKSLFVVLAVLLAAAVAGCFGRGEVSEEPAAPLRSPYPTFTPTPPAPLTPEAAAPVVAVENQPAVPVVEVGAPAAEQAGAGIETNAQPVLAVLNDDLIYIRRGPGTEYDPLQLGMRGDQFTITGRSADNLWWQICCIEEQPGWISQTYIDADGPVDNVPVVDPDTQAPTQAVAAPPPLVQPTPVPPAAPAVEAAPPPAVEAPAPEAPAENTQPTESPAPALPFALIAQEQFPESNNLVRIFLYVYQGEQVLPGFSLRVSKDGAELPVNSVSADVSGLTWPTISPRQRYHNMKVEFPGVNPGGTWQVELIDGGGAVVGPAATFSLSATDANRELYVRYEKQ